MSTLADRVKLARDKKGMTQQEVAKKSGMSQPSYYKIENGKTNRTTFINSLASVLGVNAHWLETGLGDMEPVDGVDNVRDLNESEAKRIKKVPVLNWVQAGAFSEVTDAIYDEYEYTVIKDSYSSSIYWLVVRGDSMEPVYRDGDMILVDADRQPVAGNDVIACIDGDNQATFKRYKPCGFDPATNKEYYQLIALNDFYAPIDSRSRSFHITGVVVEHSRTTV